MKTKPIFLINAKAYKQGIGEGALKIARICNKLSKTCNAEIIFSVQPAEISRMSEYVTVFAQHIDAIEPGSHTGQILPESVKEAGAKGTLINHAEKRLSLEGIEERIKQAKDAGLTTICCAASIDEIRKVAALKPDYVAIELPELIGTGRGISDEEPEIVRRAVAAAKEANPDARILCGAGIAETGDVEKAIELGTEGILIASYIMKSDDPETAIKEIANGFC